MTIHVLAERGCSNRAITRQLSIDEKAVRYRLARLRSGAKDGRAEKPFRAEAVAGVIAQWMASHEGGGVNLQVLHELLISDYVYTGSYKSVRRYVHAHFPRPKRRARRRVETPPGAQGQVDWREFPRVRVGGEERSLHASHLVLSHSRHRPSYGRSARTSSPGSTSTTGRSGAWAAFRPCCASTTARP